MAIQQRLIVIGGGAAGFFCAVNAAGLNPALEVVILEKTNKVLSKVKVSGGGRCNVTHACFSIEDMIHAYPRGAHFLKKAFHHFFTTDTIQWFKERGVLLKTEADGRMFPATDNSQTIIDCLMQEAAKHQVKVNLQQEVKSIACSASGFEVRTGPGSILAADFICVAVGGYPKAVMFEWLRGIGHEVVDPVPSLFTFNIRDKPLNQLQGLSLNAQVKIAGSKLTARGPLLITHWGLSGPAILRLSAWAARDLANRLPSYQFILQVNWLPDLPEESLRDQCKQYRYDWAKRQLSGNNPFGLPSRLWDYLLQQAGIRKDQKWAELASTAQNKLIGLVHAQQFQVEGKTTFKEEFVTAGGLALTEIDPHTMQSKILPNVYFAGEVMDVDALTGGFNFQHAWTSGFIAANAIARVSLTNAM